MSDDLKRPVDTARLANGILFGFGVFAGIMLLLPPAAPEYAFSERQSLTTLGFSILAMFTGWNSRRELPLLLDGRRPGIFFYLTNSIFLAIGLYVLGEFVVSRRRSSPVSDDSFPVEVAFGAVIFALVFFAPVYSLRVAALARELTPAKPLRDERNG